MKVLIIAGLARSGKDTIADYLAEKYGFSKYVMSSVIVEEMKKEGIDATKMNISRFGDSLRKKKGMAAVAELVYRKVMKEKAEKVVIVGPRSVEEIEFFKHKFKDIMLLKVEAPDEERFCRRSENDPPDKKGFFMRDANDAKNKGLMKVLEIADYSITNDSTIEELYEKVDSLLKKLAI